MNRKDIIRMAKNSGLFVELVLERDLLWLEAFANQIAQHTLSNIDPSKFMSYQEGMEAGRLAEREACAKLCEEQYEYYGHDHVFAKAIRARGQA